MLDKQLQTQGTFSTVCPELVGEQYGGHMKRLADHFGALHKKWSDQNEARGPGLVQI